MNTTQLECFTTLATTLNYVRTAEELNMTQPGVSRQIQSLEQELGARLFHRTTRSVSLTQIGASFLPEAQKMLNTYYHAKDWISSFHEKEYQTFKIGYSDSAALIPIQNVLAVMLTDIPNLSPEFSLAQTDANLQKLVTGELDLVFGIKDSIFENEKIIFTPVQDEYFVCVMRKDHPLAVECRQKNKNTVSTAEIFPYRQIISIPPYLMKNAFSRGHRIVPANDTLHNCIVTNTAEAYALLLAGAGYCLLPEYALLPDLDIQCLKWEESPHTKLGIYTDTQVYQDHSSTVRQFVNQMATLFDHQKDNHHFG